MYFKWTNYRSNGCILAVSLTVSRQCLRKQCVKYTVLPYYGCASSQLCVGIELDVHNIHNTTDYISDSYGSPTGTTKGLVLAALKVLLFLSFPLSLSSSRPTPRLPPLLPPLPLLPLPLTRLSTSQTERLGRRRSRRRKRERETGWLMCNVLTF